MKNAIEEGVVEIHAELLRRDAAFCACARCQDDVLAHALNNLRPRYITGTEGASLIRVAMAQEQLRAELTVVVLDAMRKVAEHPRHGADEFMSKGG